MDPTICLTVTGAAVAKSFKEAVQAYTATAPRRPKLLGILASSNAPSRRYAEWTKKACEAVGIEYVLLELCKDGDATAGQGEVEESILAANVDASVNGIMVYYPVFGVRQDTYLQQLVSPLKDVEGLNFTWLFSLYHNARFVDPRKLANTPQALSTTVPSPSSVSISDKDGTLVKAILPCTPLAIVKVLEHCQVYNVLLPYGSRAFGKTITVINRSEVVGRPLAALLANDGARVFSVDLDGIQEFSRRKPAPEGTARPSFLPHHVVQSTQMTLEECLAMSDAVVSGVPSKEYQIKTDSLKEGVVAINFSENKNFEPTIKEKASLYCPGPGGVTIAMLQRNLIRLMDYNVQPTSEGI